MTLIPVHHVDADVAIVGSGFAGSLTALALLSRGRRVVADRAWTSSALRDRRVVDAAGEPADRGAGRPLRPATHPPVFEVGHLAAGPPRRRRRTEARIHLLLPSSPASHSPTTDEHDDSCWSRRARTTTSQTRTGIVPTSTTRSSRKREAAGAVYLDMTRLDRVRHRPAIARRSTASAMASPIRITAPFVIDASGPRGFLHRALGLGEAPRDAGCRRRRGSTRTSTMSSAGTTCDRQWAAAPYPADDAALHHVFPGGWIWMLRFNNGITSAGAALTDPVAHAIGAADGAAAWDRLLATLPSVADQFRQARAALPFVHSPRVAFRSARVAGPNWALLPSAAGVIDPLLSTGFPLTLLGILRLVDLLERTSPSARTRRRARGYEQTTLAELDVTEQLVAALYATMDDPPSSSVSACCISRRPASARLSRRLGRPERAPGLPAARASDVRAAAAWSAAACTGRRLRPSLSRPRIEPFDSQPSSTPRLVSGACSDSAAGLSSIVASPTWSASRTVRFTPQRTRRPQLDQARSQSAAVGSSVSDERSSRLLSTRARAGWRRRAKPGRRDRGGRRCSVTRDAISIRFAIGPTMNSA